MAGRLDWLRGYTDADVNSNGKKFYVQTITGSANRVALTRMSKRFAKFTDTVTKRLSYSSTRTYGSFMITFGVLSLFLQLAFGFLGDIIPMDMVAVIIATVVSIFGLSMIFFDKPLAIAFQDFALTDYIFFEFFCIRRMHRNAKEKGIHFAVGIVLGALLAVLGVFVPLSYIAIVIGVCLYLFLTFLSPEFSFFSIFLAMPYLTFSEGGIVLAVMIGVTLISYIRKVACGKRFYFFEQYDIVLTLMLIAVLVSGIFVKGMESFVSSVIMILLGAGGYILSSSLVTNRRLADCIVNSVITSAVPVSFIAVYQAVNQLITSGINSFEPVTATFNNPHELAILLLVSLVFSLYFISVKRRKRAKALYVLIFLLNFVALFFTFSFWAYITLIIGFIAFGLQRMRYGSGIALAAITLLPHMALFIPDKYLNVIMGNPTVTAIGFTEMIKRWEASISMLMDNLFVGVGIGSESFGEEIANYLQGATFTDSGNFFLEVACEAGIISLAALLLIFAIRVRHRAIYRPYVMNSQVRKLSEYATMTLSVLIVFGAFNYIWANMTAYYLFWCVFGLGSAGLRVSKQEFDDRVAYFSDGRADDSSALDITIK